jgi:2,3-bisphosphoglycerate-independent phosphoglycerate mutase
MKPRKISGRPPSKCLRGARGAFQQLRSNQLEQALIANADVAPEQTTGQAHTAHTTFPVRLILLPLVQGKATRRGALADVAPTLLGMIGIEAPPEITGHSLRIA